MSPTIRSNYSFKGKHVIITGGSSGIGLELAKECVRKGSRLVTLVARNENKLSEAKKEVEALQQKEIGKEKKTIISTISVDCGKSQEIVDAAFSPYFKKHGNVDILVCIYDFVFFFHL